MPAHSRSLQLSREVSGADYIPFTAQVDKATLKTQAGDYIQVFKLEGLAHETVSDTELDVWHEQLALFMRNLNSPHLALWSYLVRQPTGEYVAGEFPPGYAHDFNERYRKLITSGRMYVNDLYLALVYRPEPTLAGRAAERMTRAFRDPMRLVNKTHVLRNTAALERINGYASEVSKYLQRYGPERLERYAFDPKSKREYKRESFHEAPAHSLVCSEALEFFGFILNGEWQRMPYLRANIASTLQTSRVTVGAETLELRGVSPQVFGAMLAWKEYPDPSFPGQLNELLRAPFEYVLAQSFTCLDKNEARGALKRQRARMESTEDDAVRDTQALQDAVEGLASNQFTMGVHHVALLVKGPDVKTLRQITAEAQRALSDCGAVVTREDLGCEPAFYSLLAANFAVRTRPSAITSRNFVGFSAFHNYPSGKPEGNHWGPALALLKTASGAPYYFNVHRRDVGHFAIFGSTGAGKSVLVMFLITMLQKTGCVVMFFDKDRGGEICIRALGGRYFAIRRGTPSGFNPFSAAGTELNIGFVQSLLRLILRTDKAFNAKENSQIDRAVIGVFQLEQQHRRLGNVLAFLEPPVENNLAARLLRWVRADRGVGPLAWLFDNDHDSLDLSTSNICGFDTTQFLDDPEVRTPLMAYLFHRIDALKDGRRGAVIIEEGWKALDDEYFEAQVSDSLKTDRKKDWILGMVTQSPKDVLRSRIAHTIAEQVPTKVFLPNINAARKDYVEGFGCTDGEFDVLRALSEVGRRFLVKTGNNAVVAESDLTALEDDLAVFSGTAANIAVLDRVRAQVGDDPKAWLPEFHRARRQREPLRHTPNTLVTA